MVTLVADIVVDIEVVDEDLPHTSPAPCYHVGHGGGFLVYSLYCSNNVYSRTRTTSMVYDGLWSWGKGISYDSCLDWLIQSKAGLESVR